MRKDFIIEESDMAGEEGGHTDTRDTEVSDACTVVVVRILGFENVCI